MFGFGPDEIEALALSVKVAFWATLLSLPLAVGTALLLARGRFWGRALLDGLVHMPLVLPPVVTGYALLLLFGTQGPVGKLLAQAGIVLAFNWTGAVLASAVMGFPLMVRAIRLSLEGVDRRLEQAAGTLGAGPLAVFGTVTLPLMLPGMLAGMVLGFAKALGEFGATITFVSNIPGRTRTVANAIYSFLQQPGGEAGAVRLAVASVVVSLAALMVSELLARRARRGRAA